MTVTNWLELVCRLLIVDDDNCVNEDLMSSTSWPMPVSHPVTRTVRPFGSWRARHSRPRTTHSRKPGKQMNIDFFFFLDLKALFLDQKLVPPLRGPSLTYKFSGDKWNPNNQYQLPCCWSGFIYLGNKYAQSRKNDRKVIHSDRFIFTDAKRC